MSYTPEIENARTVFAPLIHTQSHRHKRLFKTFSQPPEIIKKILGEFGVPGVMGGLKMYGKVVHTIFRNIVATLTKRSTACGDVLRYRVVRVCA